MPDVQQRIEAWLKQNQYPLGRYGEAAHSCGLPAVDLVFVKPDWSPVDGAHALAVTATEVLQVVCRYPSNFNDWAILARHPYGNPGELKAILDRLIKRTAGCWQ